MDNQATVASTQGEIERAEFYQKVPGLGQKRNAGLTYQFWLSSPSK
jgi:hypothetical protein